MSELDPTGQPISNWPDIRLLKEISETLKTILKEDREWRASVQKEKEIAMKMSDEIKERMDSSIARFKESLSPFSALNETMKPLSERAKKDLEEEEEFRKKIREGFSQN